jgi:ribonuclease T2
LKASVAIPEAYRSPEAPFRTNPEVLREQFTEANPGFPESAFAVNCSGSGRYLKELYVCFSREGQPTACSAEVQLRAGKSCQRPDFLVRNIR